MAAQQVMYYRMLAKDAKGAKKHVWDLCPTAEIDLIVFLSQFEGEDEEMISTTKRGETMLEAALAALGVPYTKSIVPTISASADHPLTVRGYYEA